MTSTCPGTPARRGNQDDAGETRTQAAPGGGVCVCVYTVWSDGEKRVIARSEQQTDLLGNRRGDVSSFLEFQQLSQSRRRDWTEIKLKVFWGNYCLIDAEKRESGRIRLKGQKGPSKFAT